MADSETTVLTIFSIDGQSYIGYYVKNSSVTPAVAEIFNTNFGLNQTALNGKCVFKKPARIDFKLTGGTNGTAKLDWVITPLFFKDLFADTQKNNYFAFDASKVVFSSIVGSAIDPTLVSGYHDLVGSN